jgi:hypothetical protein
LDVIFSSVYLHAGLYLNKIDFLELSVQLNESDFSYAALLLHSKPKTISNPDPSRLGRFVELTAFGECKKNNFKVPKASSVFVAPRFYKNWDCFLTRNVSDLMLFNAR